LSARVLKVVYFPDSSFLDVEIGQAPSMIWRSIVEGREVLKGGLIRWIGTGESTKIWSMDWLPTSGLRRPVPYTRPNPPQMVSELIDQSIASWDHGKLQEFFTPVDVDAITSIPLSTRRQEDFWAWHFEKRGIFSVRSTYRMLINRKFLAGSAGASDREATQKEWSTLWGIKVPSKGRVFLWRLARCSLPSKDILHHRNMAKNSVC
jgi:hypothetical protein